MDTPAAPQIGDLAHDSALDRVGVVMAFERGRYFLRPPQGGCEWTARPKDIRPAGPRERLRAEAARANAASRERHETSHRR